jgi:hypothetical protein
MSKGKIIFRNFLNCLKTENIYHIDLKGELFMITSCLGLKRLMPASSLLAFLVLFSQ